MDEHSKYLLLKHTIEDIFGVEAWYELKESGHLPTWKLYATRILKALKLSITDSVEIYDQQWMLDVTNCISTGEKNIKTEDSVDNVIASLSATLINLSFLQIGLKPSRGSSRGKYPLRKGQWRLDRYRSVVYLQTLKQRENQFCSIQQKKIGVDEQRKLRRQYRISKSTLTYEQWCNEKDSSGL